MQVHGMDRQTVILSQGSCVPLSGPGPREAVRNGQMDGRTDERLGRDGRMDRQLAGWLCVK
jgi:hypothetical protein